MTDTFLAPDPGDTQVREWYKRLMSQIFEIDETLDSTTDAAGKRKITNELVSQFENEWKPVTDALNVQMESMTPDQLAGAFYGLVRTISSQWKDGIDKWITEQVEAKPVSDAPEVSDEDKKALQEERSALAKQVKTIVEMAQSFGEAPEEEINPNGNWRLPVRRGAVGKRGKRALTLFTWQIDGVPVGDEDDSVKDVARLIGYEKSADFTAALKAAGVNTKEPGDEFTVTLNGKEVYGKNTVDEEEAEDDPTEVSSEEEEDDE